MSNKYDTIFEEIENKILELIVKAKVLDELVDIRNKYLSKKGEFSVLMNNADKIVYKLTHEIEFGQVLYDPYKNGNCLYGLKLNIYNNDIVKLLIDSGFITNKKEAEAFFIAQDIINKVNSGYKVVDLDAKIHRQIRFSDFAILCRRKSSFSYIERVFNKFGIPLNNTSKDMMSKFSVVLLLKSIFSFI